jgi:homoserine O-acetyltransferase
MADPVPGPGQKSIRVARKLGAALLLCVWSVSAAAQAPPREGDFVIRDFRCRSGESLSGLKLHVLTLGRPARDARGAVTNAVLVLHGTGGSGRQFLARQFADVLYRAGAPLDTTRTWVILPDGIGHGQSSKPSDGAHARFPHYGYEDMVEAQYRLVTEYLGVKHLRLVMGTSMGGMHTWMWGEAHPEFMDALMPLGCLPVAIVGRNRVWRQMAMEAIREDPEWKGGDYVAQPQAGLRTALDLLLIAGSSPLPMQRDLATRDSADRYLAAAFRTRLPGLDANDLMYQLDASRDYDPAPRLESIRAPLVLVNSADDFINPPELGIAEREIARVKRGRFVLIPASERTHGHGTHTWAALWKEQLEALLEDSGPHGGAR